MLTSTQFAEAVSTGPLESTIAHLTREIDFKGTESRDLQRRWITKQGELVALQVRLEKQTRETMTVK